MRLFLGHRLFGGFFGGASVRPDDVLLALARPWRYRRLFALALFVFWAAGIALMIDSGADADDVGVAGAILAVIFGVVYTIGTLVFGIIDNVVNEAVYRARRRLLRQQHPVRSGRGAHTLPAKTLDRAR